MHPQKKSPIFALLQTVLSRSKTSVSILRFAAPRREPREAPLVLETKVEVGLLIG